MKLPAISRLFSSTPSESTSQKRESSPATVVGAFVGNDQYETYADTLIWIKETKKKIPKLSAGDREDAFNADPLIRGIISPFLKNIVIGSYRIDTDDNKKFAPAIKEIKQWLEDIGLVMAYREDFDDYIIKHGKSYRRKDYEGKGLVKLAKLDCPSMETFYDPFDSSIVAYHQKINVGTTWTSSPDTKEFNSWFIPGGELYIPGEVGTDGARTTFETIKDKYGIEDVTNLRVDSNERIIAMHRVEVGDPAPIDTVVVLVWLKQLLMVNSPNMIFRILSPFVQAKNGMMAEVTENGERKLASTAPEYPSSDMATIDPEKYEAMMADYNAYIESCRTTANTLMQCLKDGGIYSGPPDLELSVIESGRNMSYLFIREMINMFDEQIGMEFGFPVSLIKANGAELATSQTIKDIFNVVYAGERKVYQTIADDLVEETFAGKSWQYEIPTKDGKTEKGTFKFEDMSCKFVLEVGDVKDQLKIAQARLADSKTLNTLKTTGASRGDIQALGEEYGFGMLGLDNFDTAQEQFQPFNEEESQASVKSTVADDLQSSEVTDDTTLSDEIFKQYMKVGAAKLKEL